jgi:hypothetical protein
MHSSDSFYEYKHFYPTRQIFDALVEIKAENLRSVHINLKFQVPSTKLQINLKSQFFNDRNRFGSLNFGHCDLFDICVL